MLADRSIRLWESALVDAMPLPDDSGPLLAGGRVAVDARAFRLIVDCLLDAVQALGTGVRDRLESRLHDGDAVALLEASMCGHDPELLTSESDGRVFTGVVELFSVPFFQQYQRRHSAGDATWTQAYCPICAAWPAFVEVLGIERTRRARCGRCGGAWQVPMLRCLYCGSSDHRQLLTLKPQLGRPSGAIEACVSCGKYTKVLTRLQGCSPHHVYVEDLATAELDVASLGAGYVRPRGLGYPLGLEVRVTS